MRIHPIPAIRIDHKTFNHENLTMKTALRLISLVTLCTVSAMSANARDPFPSTYESLPASDFLIRGAIVLTGDGERLDDADVLVRDGRIAAIGSGLSATDVEVVQADGRWLTPGIIDVHSHLGNYPAPSIPSLADGNEITSPNTAEVWTEHSVWPQDPQFPLALAGGVTTLHVLPGSANLFGGRGVTLKNVPSRTYQGMKFPGAPHSLKMACGENPKRVYGNRNQSPSTRMGNVAGYRKAWVEATAYLRKRQKAQEANGEGDGKDDRDFVPDLKLETLAGVLTGDILVHNHCYRADEMVTMIDIAREFGYKINTFHHAVESYKIADILAENNICSAMWADWWGFKLEAFDTVEQNVVLVEKAGACAIVHSDSERDIQRLNQEAAKAMAAGRRLDMDIDEAMAIRWITLNPARALGIDAVTGSITVGKAADLTLWNRNPFSVYALADLVYIDGYLYHDRSDPARQPVTDFDLQQTYRGLR